MSYAVCEPVRRYLFTTNLFHPTTLTQKTSRLNPANQTSLQTSTTLQGTNISPQNGILKMIFLFPRWDMLIPARVLTCSWYFSHPVYKYLSNWIIIISPYDNFRHFSAPWNRVVKNISGLLGSNLFRPENLGQISIYCRTSDNSYDYPFHHFVDNTYHITSLMLLHSCVAPTSSLTKFS